MTSLSAKAHGIAALTSAIKAGAKKRGLKCSPCGGHSA